MSVLPTKASAKAQTLAKIAEHNTTGHNFQMEMIRLAVAQAIESGLYYVRLPEPLIATVDLAVRRLGYTTVNPFTDDPEIHWS